MSVFLGWLPDDDATLDALARLRSRVSAALPADAPRHAWRGPRQWHMTLKYLGEDLPSPLQVSLERTMARLAADTAAVASRIDGAAYWPNARVLVARIAMTGPLAALFQHIDEDATALGIARETRKPSAHVTLAYLLRGSTPPRVDAAPLACTQPLLIERIHLLRTAHGGYDTLAQWPLARAAH